MPFQMTHLYLGFRRLSVFSHTGMAYLTCYDEGSWLPETRIHIIELFKEDALLMNSFGRGCGWKQLTSGRAPRCKHVQTHKVIHARPHTHTHTNLPNFTMMRLNFGPARSLRGRPGPSVEMEKVGRTFGAFRVSPWWLLGELFRRQVPACTAVDASPSE